MIKHCECLINVTYYWFINNYEYDHIILIIGAAGLVTFTCPVVYFSIIGAESQNNDTGDPKQDNGKFLPTSPVLGMYVPLAFHLPAHSRICLK